VKPGHILLVLLVLMALGTQFYVEYNYDYADAPSDVKTALLLGFGVTAALVLLLGPRLLGLGRKARVPL